MKKIFVCLALCVATLSTLAEASTINSPQINYSSNTITISGNVGSEYEGRFVSLFVINPGKSFSDIQTDANVLNWYDQSRVDNNGDYSFTYEPVAQTGDYNYFVTVDGMPQTQYSPQPFKYFSPAEIEIVWEKIDNAIKNDIAADIQWVIENRAEILQIDTADFEALSDENKARIYKGIVRAKIGSIDEFKSCFEETVKVNGIYNTDDFDTFKQLLEAEFSHFNQSAIDIYNSFSEEKDAIISHMMSQDFYNMGEMSDLFESKVLLTKLNKAKLWTEIDSFINSDYKIYDTSTISYNTSDNRSEISTSLLKNIPFDSMDSFKTMLYKCLGQTTPETKPPKSNGGGGGGSRVNFSVYTPSAGNNTGTDGKGENTENNLFSDVGNQYWAYKEICELYNAGVIAGYDDGTFRPESNITRAEFLKMLVSALKIEANTDKEVPFKDVAKTAWYYDCIRDGYSAGLINGTPDNTFAPDSLITREDIAAIVYRTFAYKEYDVASSDALDYTDSSDISDYAETAVATLGKEKILLGYENGEFAPQKAATRAETAVIIGRLQNCLEK